MTELPDPKWKLYPEVDYDNPEELESIDEKQERQFEEYINKRDDIDWIEKFR